MSLSKNLVAVNDNYFCAAFQRSALPIKTAVLTPNALLLEGLKIWFQSENIIDIIYAEKSPFVCLIHWQEEKKSTWPSLFLIDAHLKNMDCIEVIQRIKILNQQCKVLVMGDYTDDKLMERFFWMGADGYINLSVKKTRWINAMVTVCVENKLVLWTS